MILKLHIAGAPSYGIGDEIWHESLAEAIHAEAETMAAYAVWDLLEPPDREDRDALRNQIFREMSASLTRVGDTYRAPDGVLYSLIEEPELYEPVGGG
jgi:hypothetical protein